MRDLVEEVNDLLVGTLDMEGDRGKEGNRVVEGDEVRSDRPSPVVQGTNGVKKACEGLIKAIETGRALESECESPRVALKAISLSVEELLV